MLDLDYGQMKRIVAVENHLFIITKCEYRSDELLDSILKYQDNMNMSKNDFKVTITFNKETK